MNILVLGGGNSPEREVSLRSAKAVADAARQAGYEVEEKDPADGLSVLDGPAGDVIVLPILHGKGGEDGQIQAELEKRRLAYLGSDSKVSAKAFDKWQTRLELAKAGLPIAEGYLVTRASYRQNRLSRKPHVLKVLDGGSSIGTLIVRRPSEIAEEKLDEIFSMAGGGEILIEKLIEGIEATVPILDQSALSPIEIIPPAGDEFDYENKYNGRTQELCPPESINQDLQQECQRLSEAVHRVMGCKHLSRVDLMIGVDNQIVILEINTIPGLTTQSLYPKSAAVAGLDMPALISRFVELVQRDFKV